MNYSQMLGELYSTAKLRDFWDLRQVERCLAELGNPQKGLRCIHIAGTVGKGSVTAYIASILSQKYRVGSYFSPHVVTFRERFQINGKIASEQELVGFYELVKPLKIKYDLSFFETLTAMAFIYFKSRKVDYAVLETGMGGRLDATNLCEPILSIITHMGIDHTKYLGDSLEMIAAEKLGIVKAAPLLTGVNEGKILRLMAETCRKKNVNLVVARKLVNCKSVESSILENKNIFSIGGLFGEGSVIELNSGLMGSYQKENVWLASAAIKILNDELNLGMAEKHVIDGFAKAKLFGRFQAYNTKPLVILDGAHNVDGMNALVEEIKPLNYGKCIVVFMCMADKDYPAMLKQLKRIPHLNYVSFALMDNTRAANKLLLGHVKKYFLVRVKKDVKVALRDAISRCGKNDLVVVCGSLYLLSAFLSKEPIITQ